MPFTRLGVALGIPAYRRGLVAYPTRAQVMALAPDIALFSDVGLSQDTLGATPCAADGDPIGRWADQSGNALHFIQATSANKPTYRLGLMGSNLPTLFFDATDDQLVCTAAGIGTRWNGADKPLSVVCVSVRKNASSPRTLFSLGGAASNNHTHRMEYNNNTNRSPRMVKVDGGGVTVQSDSGVLTSTGDFNRVVASFIHAGTTAKVRVSGVERASGAYDVGAQTIDRAAIGVLVRLTPTNFMGGYIGAMLVWARAITDAEAALAELYLGAVFGGMSQHSISDSD